MAREPKVKVQEPAVDAEAGWDDPAPAAPVPPSVPPFNPPLSIEESAMDAPRDLPASNVLPLGDPDFARIMQEEVAFRTSSGLPVDEHCLGVVATKFYAFKAQQNKAKA